MRNRRSGGEEAPRCSWRPPMVARRAAVQGFQHGVAKGGGRRPLGSIPSENRTTKGCGPPCVGSEPQTPTMVSVEGVGRAVQLEPSQCSVIPPEPATQTSLRPSPQTVTNCVEDELRRWPISRGCRRATEACRCRARLGSTGYVNECSRRDHPAPACRGAHDRTDRRTRDYVTWSVGTTGRSASSHYRRREICRIQLGQGWYPIRGTARRRRGSGLV